MKIHGYTHFRTVGFIERWSGLEVVRFRGGRFRGGRFRGGRFRGGRFRGGLNKG